MISNKSDVNLVISKAWSDSDFKARLLVDANSALASVGINPPPGITIRVVEDTPAIHNYVLPLQPASELSDEHLEMVVAGVNPMIQRSK